MMQSKKPEDCRTVFALISAIRSGEINPAVLYKGTPMEQVVNDGAVPGMIKKALIMARTN